MARKCTAILLALVLVLGLIPAARAAQGTTEDGLVYETYSNRVCIIGYTGDSLELVIPETIEGLPVTDIDKKAFIGVSLDYLELPGTIESIGQQAFCKSKIKNVVLNEGIQYIAAYAFDQCTLLESISIPGTVTMIYEYAFSSCDHLTSVEFGEGIPYIGLGAFENCTNLQNVTLPESLLVINDYAFYGCEKLVTEIPDSVQKIGKYAFDETSIANPTIPASVTQIGDSPFGGKNHIGYTVDRDNPYYYSDGVALYNKEKTELIDYPTAREGGYIMPDTVRTLAYRAFFRCEKLTDLTLSESLEEIGTHAFFCCKKLTELELPDSLKRIWPCAFEECTALTHMDFPAGVSRLDHNIFRSCNALELTFRGSAPSTPMGEPFGHIVDADTDYRITATVYYPACEPSWTEKVMESYGGNITWVPYGSPFADVKEGSYCYDSVLWALENGITNGISATTFDPNGQCTRAQVVTFLWRANGSPEPSLTGHPFTDVKEGAFYYKAMLWALEQGITKGVTATTFGPNAPCNRATVLTFLHRANGSPAPSISKHPFTDVKENAFYYHAVLWAVENSITSGTTATTFSPGSVCTRGQVVTFLYRTYAN